MGNLFAAGGIVMVPLLVFSVGAIALSLERLLFWAKINRRQRPVMQAVLQTYRHAPDEVYPSFGNTLICPLPACFSKP